MNIGGIGYPGSIMRNTGNKPKSSSALNMDLILDQAQGYTSPASFLIVILKGRLCIGTHRCIAGYLPSACMNTYVLSSDRSSEKAKFNRSKFLTSFTSVILCSAI